MEEPGSLYITTLKLMQDTQQRIATIEAATGIPQSWLNKFKRGAIKEPSVNRVQALFEHLSHSTIQVRQLNS